MPSQRPIAVAERPAEGPLLTVESTRFGSLRVEAARTLRFERGLLGFPRSSTYVTIEVDDGPYLWLQSADEPEVAFLAASPFAFFPDYDLEISDAQQRALRVKDVSQVEVLILLTVHRDGDRVEGITANLLGPIVINVETRLACQLVLEGTDHTTQERLVP